MSWKKFIKSKTFLYNLLGIVVFIFLLIFGINRMLDSITHHGQQIQVPDLKGLQAEEAVSVLEALDLRYEVTDSLYLPEKAKGAIIDQNPGPDEFVKENHVIYLTVNSLQVPKVKMPALIDKNIKQAELMLESLGLKKGKVTVKRDIAEDHVLEQYYQGRNIRPDTELPKGSVIDLVIGSGENGAGEAEADMPDLVGLTVEEAKIILEAMGLSLGTVSGKQTEKATIVSQQPSYEPGQTIKQGQSINITVK